MNAVPVQLFRYPALARFGEPAVWLLLAALIIAFPLASEGHEQTEAFVLWSLWLICCILLSLVRFFQTRVRIEVDQICISRVTPLGNRTSLRWDQIISASDTFWNLGMKLTGARNASLPFPFRLANSSELVSLIFAKSPGLVLSEPKAARHTKARDLVLPVTFRPARIAYVLSGWAIAPVLVAVPVGIAQGVVNSEFIAVVLSILVLGLALGATGAWMRRYLKTITVEPGIIRISTASSTQLIQTQHVREVAIRRIGLSLGSKPYPGVTLFMSPHGGFDLFPGPKGPVRLYRAILLAMSKG